MHAWSLEFVIEGKKSEKSDFVKKSPKLQYLFFPKESEKRNNSGRVSKFLHLCYFPGSQIISNINHSSPNYYLNKINTDNYLAQQ